MRPDPEVVVFATHYPPAFRAGGPAKSISSLVRSPRNSFRTVVVTRNWDLGSRVPLRPQANQWLSSQPEHVWAFGPGLVAYARALIEVAHLRPQAYYVNSLFDLRAGIIPGVLWRLLLSRRAALVLAPRGSLALTALSKSPRRKRALLPLWRRIGSHPKVAIHAASTDEEQAVRDALGDVRIIVRANEAGPLRDASASRARGAVLRVAFLGRLVPIKGLLDLLESLEGGPPIALELNVYGPEEDPYYAAQCQRQAERLPPGVVVRFEGPIDNDDVPEVLAACDAMLNPTRGESFGQALGESLSVGTPVVVAPVTPWTRWIEAERGGLIVTGGRWREAIESLVAQNEDEVAAMRAGAHRAYQNWWHASDAEPHLFDCF